MIDYENVDAIAARVGELRDQGVDRFHVLYCFVQAPREDLAPYIDHVKITAEPLSSAFTIDENWHFNASDDNDNDAIARLIWMRGEEMLDGWDWEDDMDAVLALPTHYNTDGTPA